MSLDTRPWLRLLPLCALVACSSARAGSEPEPGTLYELSTEGSTAQVKPGGKGTFVLAIKTLKGSHVSSEAPLKLELTGGTQLKLDKEKLQLADSVAKKPEGKAYADPRFEVPFVASSSGAVDAKLTFFICTDTLCARQQKSLRLPVEVK